MEIHVDGAPVVRAARKLLAKLDAVHADKRYQAVWENARIHGMTWAGLDYSRELEALRRALAEVPGGD